MTEPVKKTDRHLVRKNQTELNAAYRERNQVKRVTINFHMVDEREHLIYEELKTYAVTKDVVLAALEQYFKKTP